jgi:glycosyltransferase involved in cell wall biosynthesis
MNPMPSRRRVLLLAPFPPRASGTHGGSRVIAQLVIGLGACHEVGLLHLQGREDEAIDDPVRQACSFSEGVPRPQAGGTLRRFGRVGAWLATGRPVWVAEWWSPEFQSRLRAISESWQPDVVQIEFHVMGQYVDALTNSRVPCVLTEHEAGVVAVDDERRYRSRAATIALAFDQRAWRRYERTMLARLDAVAVFSQRDRYALTALIDGRPVRQIPLGVTIPTVPLQPSGADSSVLFVGNFRHRPNVDAAVRLVRDIYPRIRVRHPDVRLYVVGERPPKRLSALSGDSVFVTGRVADVTPYLTQAAVVAAPIRFGGGVRVKVLEAMAAGKAVVASPRAAAEVAGDHLRLAGTDDEFAEAIVELLEHAELRAALGASARRWVIDHASPQAMVDGLDEIHDSLLAARVPGTLR